MTSHNHSALLGWPTVSSNFTFPTLAMTRICIQKSSDPATATDGPSEASEANLQVCVMSFWRRCSVILALQKFIDTFICQANQAGVEYFMFEVGIWFQVPFFLMTWPLQAFDEKWKVRRLLHDLEGWSDVHSTPGPTIWRCWSQLFNLPSIYSWQAFCRDGGACLMRSKLYVASYPTCGSLSFQPDIKEHQNTWLPSTLNIIVLRTKKPSTGTLELWRNCRQHESRVK